MTDDEILRTLRPLWARALLVEPADVTRGADLRLELGADSLDLAELALAAEEAFGLAVDEESARRARTVADLIDVLRATPDVATPDVATPDAVTPDAAGLDAAGLVETADA
jgi:acyl carrier protein